MSSAAAADNVNVMLPTLVSSVDVCVSVAVGCVVNVSENVQTDSALSIRIKEMHY